MSVRDFSAAVAGALPTSLDEALSEARALERRWDDERPTWEICSA